MFEKPDKHQLKTSVFSKQKVVYSGKSPNNGDLKNTCRGPTNSTVFLETSTSTCTSGLPETPEKAQRDAQ